MTSISSYALTILIVVALFGLVLGLIRLRQERRLRSASHEIEELQKTSIKDIQKLRDEETRPVRPVLYGIPYLAYILTSFVILASFFIVFMENLIVPYPLPEVGNRYWYSYKAPAGFQIQARVVERRETLVERGDEVTYWDRQVIQTALESRGGVQGTRVAGVILLLTIFFFILLYHINILYPKATDKNKYLILIYAGILIILACAKMALFYDLFSPYLIPLPLAGMVITILVNRRIVPLIILTTLIVILLDSRIDYSTFLVLLAGGLVSGSRVRRARKRNELMIAALLVGSIMVLVFICYRLVTQQPVSLVDPDLIASFSNGIISGLLVLIVLPVLELIFDFASPFRLMELLDLDAPVLKDFFFRAPGTYQHSMVVANIAEAVANEIGANGLLVRVGAYYHDIGKMFNPQFFIENQQGGINPHDQLGPVASAGVVRSHVLLGVKLARKIGLPSAVIDFIPEHHGTSTIDYFYFKSKELDSGIKSERIFKYPGPRPSSKETAIVMIVDSVEAAFRVIEDREEDTIRELVEKIAHRKLDQGELDRSNLTIGEFKKIIDVLTHILRSSAHQRIVYPPTIKEERSSGGRHIDLSEDSSDAGEKNRKRSRENSKSPDRPRDSEE